MTNFGAEQKQNLIIKTMKKLPIYIKYVEKEYGICILEQTKKREKPQYSYGLREKYCA